MYVGSEYTVHAGPLCVRTLRHAGALLTHQTFGPNNANQRYIPWSTFPNARLTDTRRRRGGTPLRYFRKRLISPIESLLSHAFTVSPVEISTVGCQLCHSRRW